MSVGLTDIRKGLLAQIARQPFSLFQAIAETTIFSSLRASARRPSILHEFPIDHATRRFEPGVGSRAFGGP